MTKTPIWSVRARWILTRRLRVSDQFESALHEQKPHGKYFLPSVDLKEVSHFDRYVTQADRRLHRALKSLQLVQKMARDDERWQLQFESQKLKFAADAEKFNLMREKAPKAEKQTPPPEPEAAEPETAASSAAEDLPELTKEVCIDIEFGPYIPQNVYAVFNDDGKPDASDRILPQQRKSRPYHSLCRPTTSSPH